MTKKQRIMFLTAGLGAGGAEKYTVTIANQLTKTNSVSLICIYPGGVNVRFLDSKVHLIHANKHRILAGLGILVTELKKIDPAFLICNKDDVAVLGMIGKTLASVKTRIIARVANKPVYYCQDNQPIKQIKYWLFRYLYNHSHCVICVSESLKSELLKLYDLKDEQVKVIYNPPGIISASNHEKTIPARKNTYKLVTIGRLVKQKNHKLFIDIVANLRKHICCEGFIVGTGVLKDELKKHAKLQAVDDRIHFVDYIENPVGYLQSADVYLLTSYYEGLSGSLIHALISGVNIVSVNCEHGVAEILDNGQFGTLLTSYSAADYVDAIKKKIGKPHSYHSDMLSKHLGKFELATITKKWHKLLQS